MSRRFNQGIFTRAAMAGVLAAGLVPCAAFATSSGDGSSDDGAISVVDAMAQEQSELLDELLATGNLNVLSGSNDSDESAEATLDAAWPDTYDLREAGTVTPVKSQLPWSTCWSFAACAAAETSILNELGLSYNDWNIDLSERQLAWFSQTALPSGSQAGEGCIAFDPSKRLNTGGQGYTATSVFASGIGPVPEAVVPYKNNDDSTMSYRDLYGDEGAEAMKETNPSFDVDAPDFYSPNGDWSVDESYRFMSMMQLENGSILPSPATITKTVNTAEDGKTKQESSYSYNENGTAAIKQQLLAGNAVQVGFLADTSTPGQAEASQYINTETWAHYTYEPKTANHAVTIVGWDDNYSKENFLEGHQPANDGAWIVKNSWGSSTEDFPNNNGGWGVDGEGYFYLSYYDQSITNVEVFDFDTSSIESDNDHYIADSYSYMPTGKIAPASTEGFVQMANVFTAEENQMLRYVSSETASDNMSVTYDVYLLDDDAEDPTDGKRVASVSDNYQYQGFHRTALNSGVVMKAGQRYSVAVTMRTVDGKYQYIQPTGLGKWAAEFLGLPSYSAGVVNKGESALYSEGKWVDWTDCIAAIKEKLGGSSEDLLAFDNLPVRAYSDPYTTPTFSDVADTDWFAPAVAKVADAGLMIGYSGSDLFGVGHTLTRAELATILWRDANPVEAEAYSGIAENETSMADVEADAFYTAAVNWAVENGVVDGVELSDGSRAFQPDRAVTFEETVAMIAKYAKAFRGATVDGETLEKLADDGALERFADAGSVSSWARANMTWATEEGLVNGEKTDEGTLLKPVSDLMRERAAGVLSNAIDLKIIG